MLKLPSLLSSAAYLLNYLCVDMAHARGNSHGGGNDEINPISFHDFLGDEAQRRRISPLECCVEARPPMEVSVSATSDLGSSERNAASGYYGMRRDAANPTSSSHFSGNKRSNSESFMASQKDRFFFRPGRADSQQDSPFLNKFLREDGVFGMQRSRPISQPSSRGARTLGGGPVLHYPPRAAAPFCYPLPRAAAADEGSRTGIKRHLGFSTSMSPDERQQQQPAGFLIGGHDRRKPGAPLFSSHSQQQLELTGKIPSEDRRECGGGGKQMTIFYGGQAHVFDSVPPNKADVIMGLAGSIGGSWSTKYKPDSGMEKKKLLLQPAAGDAADHNNNNNETTTAPLPGTADTNEGTTTTTTAAICLPVD